MKTSNIVLFLFIYLFLSVSGLFNNVIGSTDDIAWP